MIFTPCPALFVFCDGSILQYGQPKEKYTVPSLGVSREKQKKLRISQLLMDGL